MKPTKENTLHLPVEQVHFDAILDGTKKQEYREIKDATYRTFLSTWEEGDIVGIHFDENIISADFYKHSKNPMVYNNGVYPYTPIPYKFLNLASGNNNNGVSLLVKVEDIHFKPLITKHGKEARFNFDGEHLTPDDNGKLCIWHIVYNLGEIVETNVRKVNQEIRN